ncbi:MAG: MlaD family protein [Brevinematia bacterium]
MYKFSVLEKIVGSVVVVTIFLVFILILFLGRANEWFRPSVTYYTVLKSASDVTPGKKVYYKGIVIGKVSKVSLQGDDFFRVEFQIYSEYTNRVKSDSLFIVRSELLGGKKFDITQGGDQARVLNEGEMVYSLDTYEGKILAKLRGYYSPEEDISRIINNISLITSYLVDYVSEEGEVRKTLENINTILTNVNLSVAKLNTTTLPSVNTLLSERLPLLVSELIIALNQMQMSLQDENIPKTLKNLKEITSDISEITEELKRNKGNISNLIVNLEKLSKNLNDITVSLKDIVR